MARVFFEKKKSNDSSDGFTEALAPPAAAAVPSVSFRVEEWRTSPRGNSTSCIVVAVTERGCEDKPCVKKLEGALDTVSESVL
ncbi:unnamed protein product [Urochloa humidicola]